MSLYELMRCAECGHARHRHHFEGYGRDYGRCKLEGSDGRCPCPKFKEMRES